MTINDHQFDAAGLLALVMEAPRPNAGLGTRNSETRAPLTITFHEDGSASCLYSDALVGLRLGPMRMRRASWIDFNEHTQRWEVRFDPHEQRARFSHPAREACLAWEREELSR